FGYLSGGCLEQAVALEAKAAIKAGANRLVRYGRGSPYFDVKLPCGSGLDLYFDQGLAPETLAGIEGMISRRQPATLHTDLATGAHAVRPADADAAIPASLRDGGVFTRAILPPLRLVLIGSGPAVGAIARLVALIGFEIEVLSPDAVTLAEVRG